MTEGELPPEEKTPELGTPLPPFQELETPSEKPAPVEGDPPTLEQIRENLEQIPSVSAVTEAALPFSLLLEHSKGAWPAEDREKLLTVLSQHQMGIRELDLEPQFEQGKVLIPRISEYAAVLIVQALRNLPIQIHMDLSDRIFSTPETRSEPSLFAGLNLTRAPIDPGHPAEQIPITPGDLLPGQEGLGVPGMEVIDTIVVSATIDPKIVDAENSEEYAETVEALKRQLRYRAHHRGATGIIRFAIQMIPLTSPTSYRLILTGCAVKSGQIPFS